MLWGVPQALLFLLGAIPLILFLHSLRPKGLQVRTTAFFLWERVLRERPMGKRLGWLFRKNLLLILQLLIALLLIAALADPSLLHIGAHPGDTVVVLDLSASMKARGSSGSRFEAARKELFSLIEALPSSRRMMIIGAGPDPRVLAPFTGDKGKLREVARSAAATDAPARVKDAILFAHAFLQRGRPDRVAVISDGAFAGAEEFAWQTAPLQLIRVDGGRKNVGIVGFEVRRQPEDSSRYEIMVHIKNFSANPIQAPLTLELEGKTIAREELGLAAGGRRVLVYPFEGSLTGALEARLDVQDDFATDNRAYLAVSETPVVHLLYVGAGNPFLSNLLRYLPHIEVTAAERWDPELADGANSRYDVVILDRVPAPALTRGNFILIDTVAPNLPLRVRGKIQRPRLLTPVAKHPVTDGVDLGELYIQEALRLVPEKEGTVLASSREGPLMFALEKGRLRALILGFDLLSSDLPFRVAFAVLIHNAVEWFQPNQSEFPARGVPAGTPFALRLPAAADHVEVASPSGKKENLRVVSSPLIFTDTFEAGFYRFKSSVGEGRFAVNLFDESESEITPRAQTAAQPDSSESAGRTEKARSGFSLWPFLLVAGLILLAAEAFLAFRAAAPLFPVAARVVAFAVLVAAVVNPRILRVTNALDVVLGVDFSRSVGQEAKEKARQILEAAARIKHPESRTGLMFFGRQPAWEFLPRADFVAADSAPRLEREETDIQTALQAALAQIGEGQQGRIVLISDGNENRGQSSRVIPLLRAQGAQVWTLPVSLARGRNEIYLSDLTLPQRVDSAESFEVRGAIESLHDAVGRVKLLRDGSVQRERELPLKAGTNRVSFKESLRDRGSHRYELLVESADDTLPENNLLQGVVEVQGPPRILYLTSQNPSQRFLARVLQVQGYSVVESSPETHPLTLPEISSFDLVILDNVAAYELSLGKMEAIEKYVKDLGGGLWVVGGSQSYGAGGYFRTPFEGMLPVDMRPPVRLDLPHVALLFVLDKSGSMGSGPEGSTKLDLAKAAAMAAADIMNPKDQVGILGFDAEWNWVLPFRPVGKGEWISEGLSSLQSDGGTDLYKAMVEAHRSLTGKEAAIKHILVLSDGLTDKMDFPALVAKVVSDGITVSTVSVGQDADVKLLAEIAKNGRGRGYVTLDPQTIPQIFTTETLLISRDLLVEKPITPEVVAAVGPLRELPRSNLPMLRGYVLTYPKPRGELLMKVDQDPLLVSWRYGLGRVTAYTSDLSGRWGREWVKWEGFPRWASQLARGTMRKISENRMRADIQPQGDGVNVVADFLSQEGRFLNHLNLRGNLTAPDRTTQESALRQIAPGRYEGKFSTPQRGIYLLTLYAEGKEGEEPLPVGTVPYIAPYPKEYKELTPNSGLLSRLAEETGGEMLDPDRIEEGVKRLYTPSPGKATLAQETWWPLSGLGLILFLADLALRRWPRKPAALES